jgi:hypothetical protein
MGTILLIYLFGVVIFGFIAYQDFKYLTAKYYHSEQMIFIVPVLIIFSVLLVLGWPIFGFALLFIKLK